MVIVYKGDRKTVTVKHKVSYAANANNMMDICLTVQLAKENSYKPAVQIIANVTRAQSSEASEDTDKVEHKSSYESFW